MEKKAYFVFGFKKLTNYINRSPLFVELSPQLKNQQVKKEKYDP